jgi:hypothetical protein
MPERLSPILERAFVHTPDWKPSKRRRSHGSWPQAAFLLTTVARPRAGEPLHFGACALLPSLIPGQHPVDLRVFYADDCPAEQREAISQVAAAHGLGDPLSRRGLVELLYKRCYKQGLPLVGFGLPADLGRLAVAWETGREGGFSLTLSSRPCPPGPRPPAEQRRRPLLPNGEIENGDRPRYLVNPLEGQRAAIRFGGRGRPDDEDREPDGEGGKLRKKYIFPGRFVDTATLASVQASTRFPTLAAAAAFFGITEEPTPPLDSEGTVALEIESALATLDTLAALYLRLLDCHAATPGGTQAAPDQVYSVAAYAEALFEQVGLAPPLARCGLPAEAHAYGMAAFFGGDCGVAVRHQDTEVVYLDDTGHYPVSAHVAGSFELLRATKLELVEEDPAELQRLLASLSREQLLSNPDLWKRFGRTVCLFKPQGDLVPHRVPNGNSVLLKIAPLTSSTPVPRMLADLAVSVLRSGLLPEIVSAFSIRTVARRRKRLRPLLLPSGFEFDPRRHDLILVLAEERLRLKRHPELPPAERDRQAKLLKLIVNAACYGLLCQINIKNAAGELLLTHLDGSTRTLTREVVEEPGRWTHPLLAASVTATGRLLLQLFRTSFEQAGATVCNWDTDSLCLGGLSPIEVAAVQAELERLSAYDPGLAPTPGLPFLLALEDENFDPATGDQIELRLWATASKNYDLYQHHPDGTLTLRKGTEHGLGHLRTPDRHDRDDRDWIAQGRHYLLAHRLRLQASRPDWWHEPALSVTTLNRPEELARLQASQPPGTSLMPFSRLAVAHPTAQYARDQDGHRRTPVAPFHDGFTLDEQATWRDLTTGEPLSPRYPADGPLRESDLTTTIPGAVICDTVGRVLARNSRRPENKALDQHGNPCTRHTTGLLHPAPTEAIRIQLIGKETRNLERAGITEDPTHTLYTDPEDEAWKRHFLPVLRELAPGLIPRGRPSRRQRAELVGRAGKLAQTTLRQLDPSGRYPDEAEQACYLYLKRREQRVCACGCCTTVSGRSRYAAPSHRMRAFRSRHAARGV